MAGRYVGFGKKLFDLAKGSGDKSNVATTIVGVTPKVNKTKLDEAKSKLNIAIQKTKASSAKLGQTLFESKNKSFKGDDFTFGTSNKKTLSNTEKQKLKEGLFDGGSKLTKRAKGGRVGLKRGTGLMKKKSNIQKIKETFGPKNKSTKFGMLSVKAGIDKNPNPTQADRIAGAKMKNKKRFV